MLQVSSTSPNVSYQKLIVYSNLAVQVPSVVSGETNDLAHPK